LLKTTIESETKRVERGGLAIDVPARWIVLDEVGTTVLTAYDPQAPDRRYNVAVEEATEGASLADAAGERLRDRAPFLTGLTVLEEGPASLDGTTTHAVRYAFVDTDGPRPVVIEASEQSFQSADRIVVVWVEAPADQLEAALPRFEDLARRIAGTSP
jgi:hypothetical protein